jgi:hypothetical protein
LSSEVMEAAMVVDGWLGKGVVIGGVECCVGDALFIRGGCVWGGGGGYAGRNSLP